MLIHTRKVNDSHIKWQTLDAMKDTKPHRREDLCRILEPRGKGNRLSATTRRFLGASLFLALTVITIQSSIAVGQGVVKIAVFDFELDDRSFSGGIIDQDAIDSENLKNSTEEVRRMLEASGRYSIVDVSSAAGGVLSAGGILHCNGCEGPLAKKLGADQSMIGIIARVSRTEYSVQILVRNTQSGAIVSNVFTGLRMGANYSWPRGVKWLMKNKIMSVQHAE